MNTLTKWNPFSLGKSTPAPRGLFRELEEIEDRLEALFQRRPQQRDLNENSWAGEWFPTVDIIEEEDKYVIKADLPEVSKSDVKVCVKGGVLEISGERKAELEEKGKRYHRVERSYGAFFRSFALPPGLEGEKAKADFNAGVLTVRIPKNEKTSPKAIEIKVG